MELYTALVLSAPAPELIAVLLDQIDDAAVARSLLQAIEQRPEPSLVTPLRRWFSGHRSKVPERVVDHTIDACRAAAPWAS